MKTDRRKWNIAAAVGAVLISVGSVTYLAQPWGPGPNGPWSAADHNRDELVTREEMEVFGGQKPYRNLARLLMHFDAADTNHDGIVTQKEIDAYGKPMGSKDPYNHKP